MKVVYNNCYGGFGLSKEALQLLSQKKGCEIKSSYDLRWEHGIKRHDADLVAVVEQLGDKASDRFSDLRVEEIPDGCDYEIDEYDGNERVLPPRMKWEDMVKNNANN